MQIIVCIVLAILLVLVAIRNINIIQLQSYGLGFYGAEMSYQIGLYISLLLGEIICLILSLLKVAAWYWLLIAFCVPLLAYVAIGLIKKSKTPLVVTARVMRYFALFTILTLAFFGGIYYLSIITNLSIFYYVWINFLLTPLTVRLAFLLIAPLEKHIQNKYFNKAVEKLDSMQNLMKIGITGSYGKTSVKNIMATILSESFEVVASPFSYNTPMGLAKSVNEITESTQVFIMEIGARHIGDVAKIAKALKPQVGVITGVAGQHLKTFGSVEDVMRGKYELIEALDNNGLAVFNGENARVKNMYDRCILPNKMLTSIDSGNICVENLLTTTEGTVFDLKIGDSVRSCRTKLIGRHNIENILLAVTVAVGLGMDIDSISYGIEKLEFTPHRLEVIKANGITIIDDSYNANEVGVQVALDTLSMFDSRKVVVCQGIVEGGEKEDEINYNLGVKMSSSCDIAILVGKLADKLQKGLVDSGYNPTRIIKYKNLREAQSAFKDNLRAGDVLLLLNDLPDNY